jgi:hypothetical protein
MLAAGEAEARSGPTELSALPLPLPLLPAAGLLLLCLVLGACVGAK